MEAIEIETTDIIFKNDSPGKGKIIISDNNYDYNFSYYWNAMGTETIQDFILSINSDYFVKKLSTGLKGPLDIKQTFKNIRKTIKESLENSGYFWYNYGEFQKDIREKVNEMQQSNPDDRDLIDSLGGLKQRLDFYLIDNNYDRKDIESIFDNMWDEYWYMFEYQMPKEELFLENLHKKLQKAIRNGKEKVKI